jgi:hypothetical protein
MRPKSSADNDKIAKADDAATLKTIFILVSPCPEHAETQGTFAAMAHWGVNGEQHVMRARQKQVTVVCSSKAKLNPLKGY